MERKSEKCYTFVVEWTGVNVHYTQNTHSFNGWELFSVVDHKSIQFCLINKSFGIRYMSLLRVCEHFVWTEV